MRHVILFVFFLSFPSGGYAVHPHEVFPTNKKQLTLVVEESVFSQLTLEEILTLKKKEIRLKVGRKLTVREQVGLKVLKKSYQKAGKRDAGKKFHKSNVRVNTLSLFAVGFLVLGLIPGVGWVFLLIGLVLGIIYMAKVYKTGNRQRKRSILAFLVIGLLVLALKISGFNSRQNGFI